MPGMGVDKLLKLYKEVTEHKKVIEDKEVTETKEQPAKLKNYKSYQDNYKRNYNIQRISKF